MKKATTNYVITLIRRDFDSTCYEPTNKRSIKAAIDFAGLENETVQEMIRDYETYFDIKFE